jgi:hypothetical protein
MNEYFQPAAVPAPNSPGASAVMRSEFARIAAGFDKLPVMTGSANELIAVNSAGTSLVATGVLLTDFATLTGVQELTNKTISWANNTFTGFGDAATKVAGTGAGEVLLLAEANKLPALNGSLLTNLSQSNLDTVSIAHGGTGATDLTGAQANLGINLKADADNAVLTGAPTAPTPNTGDASARIATTYFVADTMQAIGAFGPSSMNPLMNGVVSPGVSVLGSRGDHVHPTDTSRAPVASPTFTGVPAAPTAAVGDNTTQLATTAFVNAEITNDRPYSASNPLMDGTAAQGTSPNVSRQDHVHPTDTSRAPINSPTFTGDPKAPTPLTTDNDTSIATTAFVQSLLAQQPPAGMQPSNSTPLMNGTAAAGSGVDGSRYDHVHPSDTSKLSLSGGTMTGALYAAQGDFNFTWLNASGADTIGFACLRSDKTTTAGAFGVSGTNGVEDYSYVGSGASPSTTGVKVNASGTLYNTITGGQWVNWNSSRAPLIDVLCALGDSAYLGIRWKTTAGTPFAAIDADPNTAVGVNTVLRFHVGTLAAALEITGAGNRLPTED